MGYRWYDASNGAPQFPFGHGLSYTTFGYSNLAVSAVSRSGQVAIGMDTGSRAGAEIVQLYLGFPAPAQESCGVTEAESVSENCLNSGSRRGEEEDFLPKSRSRPPPHVGGYQFSDML